MVFFWRVTLWAAINRYARAVAEGRDNARMDAVVEVEQAVRAIEYDGTDCPDYSLTAPARVVLEEPEHIHVRVGPLLYCFRHVTGAGQVPAGWAFIGARIMQLGAVVTEESLAAMHRAALAMVVGRTAKPAPAAPAEPVCPECKQRFAQPPAGPAPHEWFCGPEHGVTAANGDVTIYTPGEPAQYHPATPPADGAPPA